MGRNSEGPLQVSAKVTNLTNGGLQAVARKSSIGRKWAAAANDRGGEAGGAREECSADGAELGGAVEGQREDVRETNRAR